MKRADVVISLEMDKVIFLRLVGFNNKNEFLFLRVKGHRLGDESAAAPYTRIIAPEQAFFGAAWSAGFVASDQFVRRSVGRAESVLS